MLLDASNDFVPVEEELRRMVDASNHPSRFREDRALNCLERVLIYCNDLNPSFEMAGVDVRARRAMELIGERLADPPSVAELARNVGLSRSRFTAVFSDATGLSPRAYTEAVRLTRAAQMLLLSTAPVGQIAEQVGFLNAFHFSARFRAHYGLPPSVYRSRFD
jgi:transcriptional regulator GlxA family with amidase domain